MAVQLQARRVNPWPFVAIGVVLGLLVAVGAFVLLRGGTTDCSGTIKLRIAASQDKVKLLQRAADGFSDEGRVDGKCVSVVVDSKNSGTALKALARGWKAETDGERPDIWAPASDQWARLLKHQAPDAPIGEPQPIVTTPLTIAMPRPMAEALGWPNTQIGWKDLAELATSGGWASKGHPEWGEFRLGKTNPNFSTSGFNATVAAYFAATGSTSDLTQADIADQKNRQFLQNIEKSIVHYGDTALTFLQNLQRADDRGEALKYISAVTLEEDFVWTYNQGNPTLDPDLAGKHPKPKIPLVAFYPKEGTLLSNHPYVPLNWMSGEQKKASDALLTYLHTDKAQKVFTDHGYRNHKGEPNAMTTQENGLLPDQPKILLKLPGTEIMNAVLTSWNDVRKPAKVLLVMDKSGSMGEKVGAKSKLELAKAAAVGALSQFAAHDQVALWQFSSGLVGNQDYQEVVPFGTMNSAHRAKVESALNGIKIQGGTGLYNTTAAAYDALRQARAAGAINAVVVMTDGKNDRDAGIRDLETLTGKLLNREGEPVRVFTLAFGEGADLETLQKIAQATEGAAYDSRDPNSISEVFAELLSNF